MFWCKNIYYKNSSDFVNDLEMSMYDVIFERSWKINKSIKMTDYIQLGRLNSVGKLCSSESYLH